MSQLLSEDEVAGQNPSNDVFQLFVKLLDGKTMAMSAYATDRVSVITEAVQRRGFPPSTVSLTFNGHPLCDDCLLLDYGITKDSTVRMAAFVAVGDPLYGVSEEMC